MPDNDDQLDPALLALARALGRFQANLDLAEERSPRGDRNNDFAAGIESTTITAPSDRQKMQ